MSKPLLSLPTFDIASSCAVPYQIGGVRKRILLLTATSHEFASVVQAFDDQLFQVQFASDGWQSLAVSTVRIPSAIFVDSNLLNPDWRVVCNIFRTAALFNRVPIIVLARGLASLERAQAVKLGASDCIDFPSPPQEIVAILAALIQRTKGICKNTICTRKFRFDLPIQKAVQHALFLIELDCSVTPSDIARAVGLSKRKLAKLFQENFSITLAVYLRERKFAIAKYLLEQTILPINQISDLLGFHSQCNFSVAFCQQVGVPPRAYRARSSTLYGADTTSTDRKNTEANEFSISWQGNPPIFSDCQK